VHEIVDKQILIIVYLRLSNLLKNVYYAKNNELSK